MTLQEIRKTHPNRWCILIPKETKPEFSESSLDLLEVHISHIMIRINSPRHNLNRVATWSVLNVFSSFEEAKAIYDEYRSEGVSGVVIYDTAEAFDEACDDSQAAAWARFFRVCYKLED